MNRGNLASSLLRLSLFLIAVTLVHLGVRVTTAITKSIGIVNSSATSVSTRLVTQPLVGASSPAAASGTSLRFSIAGASNGLTANLNGKIAFSASDLIRMINADGTGLVTVGNGLKPAWSADGTQLAFLSGSSFVTSHDVYVVNADGGTGLLKIGTNASGETAPTWSPAGDFVAYQGLDNAVYRADKAGTSVTKLFDNPDTLNGLRWSPTGQQFAIAKGGDIYVLSTDGSNQTKITSHPSQSSDSNPRWSPDGQKIIFTRGLDAHVVGADGTGESRLLNLVYAKNATWSPDGQKVAFQLPAALGIMNVDGTLFSEILLNVVAGTDPDWQPVPTGLPLPSPSPSPTVFTISGHIDPTSNTSGTYLHLTGTRSGERGIDANGNYSFVNLPIGGDYSVTTENGLVFIAPTSRTYSNLSANQTAADFVVAGNVSLSITGRLSDPNGNSIVGASVSITGPNPTNTLTDSNGRYEFKNLVANTFYQVFPTPQAVYHYTPGGGVFVFLTQSQILDLVGYKDDPITISGRVTEAANPGVGVASAQVVLKGIGISVAVTDADGNYTFPNLIPAFDYTVAVNSPAANYFPNQIFFKRLTRNQKAYFVRNESTGVGSISGHVADGSSSAVGVSVSLAGGSQMDTITDENGNYTFPGLPLGFDYLVTSHVLARNITPVHATVSNLAGSVNGLDFVAVDFPSSSPAFQFSSDAYTVPEDVGSAVITVTRSGPSAPATVDYAAVNGSATSPGDYTSTSGTLSFGEGESTKTFSIPITDDSIKENPETVNLILKNPTPGWFDYQSVSVLTITDTDTAPGPSPTPTPTPSQAFEFSAANYSVNEGGGGLTVTVNRIGDTSGVASVGYSTMDDTAEVRCDTINGSAYPRCDYATSLDRLTFGPGETSKTFSIPIVDDAFAEGTEHFGIALQSPSGASLGSRNTAVVTINDNDVGNGTNPIFSIPFFVREHYLDFLSREPEAGEPWSAVLNNCSDVNNNPACDRLTVSAAFFGSPEFQLKGYYVYRFYKVASNRLPTYAEMVVDMRSVTGQTPAEVFQKKAAFAIAFVQRPEFAIQYAGVSNSNYVAILLARYALTDITTFDPANPDGVTKVRLTMSDLINQLGSGALTRAQVLRAIADSDEVLNLEFNKAFVAMQYYGYLRRTPEDAGYNAWLNYLNTHPTDSRTMVNGFMNSVEYRLRFGP